MLIKGCEAIIKCLLEENTDIVFGYPGAAILPLYDALSKSSIKNILVRHEANAGHSASGYARICGKPGVCISTSGPGSTNLITAIATAYMDSIPIIIITGQVSTEQIGRDVFQEADITGSAEPFVKHSYLIKSVNDIPRIFKEAFYICRTGRPGPVLIDIPIDIQIQSLNFEYPQSVSLRSYKPTVNGNKLQIKRIITALSNSQKPLLCVGGGVLLADAQREATIFSDVCNIPVVSTMMGLSCFSNDNPLYFGMIGLYGTHIANKALSECDLLIVIGARFGDMAINSPNLIKNGASIIHIDIDPAEIGKNMTSDIPVVGNSKVVLKQILELTPPMYHKKWADYLQSINIKTMKPLIENGYINPCEFINRLSHALPDKSVVVADVGKNQLWCANNFHIKKGRFLTSGGMGTMGYSIPAAIGAKLADVTNEVIAICGDGSFLMQMMELATAFANKVSIKIIVINNGCLGLIKQIQKDLYNSNFTAISLDGNPDYVKLANAFSIDAIKAYDEETALKAIDRIISSKGTFLVECIINPDADLQEDKT